MFETGKVDLAAVPEPWASILVKNGAKVIIGTDKIAYGKTLPNTVLVTSDKLLKNNKEIAQGIAKAGKRSSRFYQQ